MNRIRSQGLLSARLADTPSDPEMLYGLREARLVSLILLARRATISHNEAGVLVGAEHLQ